VFIDEISLWIRICNLPYANGQATDIFRLDFLHHPTAPCHSNEVKFDLFDVTGSAEKVVRGDSHSYMTFALHKSHKYEIVTDCRWPRIQENHFLDSQTGELL
jgi:hypothetical protein